MSKRAYCARSPTPGTAGCGGRRSGADLGFRPAVPLITALLEHPDPMVREGACEALGLFREPAAVPALAARLNDETTWVRSSAAPALGHIGGDLALAALWQAMIERRNPKASHLASAIATFGPPVVNDLIALTADPDPDLRALACRRSRLHRRRPGPAGTGTPRDPRPRQNHPRRPREARGSRVICWRRSWISVF
ncbi:HEAT repeat domain-containing protein [Streptomyces roseus]|uniref:HEAT repeat domain-containing protein n=1 Tax=Streptomyces roseus TaxID=66430 RepID=UPI00099BA155|nr:HEAT repeat domain-containing protein [Streptomyces roseus]